MITSLQGSARICQFVGGGSFSDLSLKPELAEHGSHPDLPQSSASSHTHTNAHTHAHTHLSLLQTPQCLCNMRKHVNYSGFLNITV